MPKQLITLALALVVAACDSSQVAPSAESNLKTDCCAYTASSVSIVSSSVSRNPLIAGQVQSASVTLTSSASLYGLIVDIRIYRSSDNSMYGRREFNPVDLLAGAQRTVTYDFASPASMPPGQYELQIGVWDRSWNTLLYETRNPFMVNAPAASAQVSVVRSSVSRNPLVAGQVQSASVTLTSTTSVSGLIVDIRIYNTASDSMYARKEFNPVSIPAGGQTTLTYDFQSPANMPPGQYDVRVGVWDTSWNTLLYQTRDAFTVTTGGGGGGGTPIPVNCQEGILLAAGSYLVENNQWGKDGVYGSYSQCVGNGGVAADGSVSARWTWTWPNGPSEVKGYPSIIYGQKPGFGSTPGSNLPRRVNDLSGVTSSWSTRGWHSGTGQLTFDLWLQRDGARYPSFLATPITHEIMVAVEPYGGYGLNRNPAWFVEEIVINGIRYKTYKAEGFGPQGWRFLVFQMLTPMVSGTLDFRPLFDYLKSRGFIRGDEYLASVEFGSEIEQGSGDVTVDSFKTTVY